MSGLSRKKTQVAAHKARHPKEGIPEMGSGSRINRATGRKARVTASISKPGRAGAIKRSNGKAVEKRVDQKKRTVTGKGAIKAKNAASAEREKGWRQSASQNQQRKNVAQN